MSRVLLLCSLVTLWANINCTATTLQTGSSHVEVSAGSGGLVAQGTSIVKAINVDAGHFNKVLEISGLLYSNSDCLEPLPQIANDTCFNSIILTQEGQQTTCGTSDFGSCGTNWALRSRGVLVLAPEPSISATASKLCNTGSCNSNCPPGQECNPWDDQ